MQGHNISNPKFANNTDIIEEPVEGRNKLQKNMNGVRKGGEACSGTKDRYWKNKKLVTGKENIKEQLDLENIEIESVTEFTCL